LLSDQDGRKAKDRFVFEKYFFFIIIRVSQDIFLNFYPSKLGYFFIDISIFFLRFSKIQLISFESGLPLI